MLSTQYINKVNNNNNNTTNNKTHNLNIFVFQIVPNTQHLHLVCLDIEFIY